MERLWFGDWNRDKRNGEGKQASSCFSIAIRLHRRCAHQSRHCRKFKLLGIFCSCSLETLSTLKFAQRAKFIKNNAVVNEDASGDVVAMRLQIQQLKKEVSHLRAFVNGKSENLDNDNLASSIPASPGPFKWECPPGSFSPLSSDKRMSQKKDYEVALVGAFKREREKEAALQALTAENQAAMQLIHRSCNRN
ncbi:hypothetical protein V6Z12_D12G090400 [Gossypium hirsutum]